MVGIVMIQDLHCPFMIMKEIWYDIIYSVQNYLYGMMLTGSYIYMM